MIIVKHRINSIKKLKKTSVNFGIEFDVRSYSKKIIIEHSPFKKVVKCDFYKFRIIKLI